MDKYIEEVLNQVDSMIDGNKPNRHNLIKLTVNLMKFVEKYPDIHGVEKKQLVIAVLERYLEKTGVDKAIIQLIPSFIDMAVALSKKEVVIKMVEEVSATCCGWC